MPGRRGLSQIEVRMKRVHLRCVSHFIALKIFQKHHGIVDSEEIKRALIEACRDRRNADMTAEQFAQASQIFVPREIGRLARRQARALAEQTQ
jgi:hypothetical protein